MDVHQVVILDEFDKKSNVPNIQDYENICRVCLTVIGSSSSCSKSIHEEESKMNIRSLLEIYTYVKIPEYQDMLPQNICRNCLDFLIEIHTFRSRCRVNDDLLHKIQKKHFDKDTDSSLLNTIKTEKDDFIENETQAIINKINDERMGIFRCKDCPEIFEHMQALMKHRKSKNHSRKPASACPHCGKMFNSTALIQHIRIHTKEKPFACNICEAAFAVKNNLRRHIRIHSNERAFTCEVCGKSFLRSESLAAHLRRHEEEKIKLEKIANGIYEDECEAIENKVGCTCPLCDKVCKSEEHFKIHIRYHKQKFLCNECGKVFSSKANLVTHIRVHTGEKPFECPICKKGFSQSSSLRIHMSVHDGSKAYACEFCDRKFSVKGNLNAHKRMHTGSSPHRCNICDKGFCTSSTLRKHLRGHAKKQEVEKGGDDNGEATQEHEHEQEADDFGEEIKQTDDEHIAEEEVYVMNDEEEIIIEEYQEGEEVYYEEEYLEEDEEQSHDPKGNVQECKVHITGEVGENEVAADVIMFGPKKFNLHIVP